MSAGALHFGAPWALAALAALPLLWLLLRAIPPAPLRVIFPPLALLRGLETDEETPDSAPLWLRVLRLGLATLLIMALAAPTWTPSGAKPATGPLILIVDNGWASAGRWPSLRKTASGLINAATGDAAVLMSASNAKALRFESRRKAQQALGGAKAEPWPPQRMAALDKIRALKTAGGLPENARIVWLSDGLDYGHARTFMAALAQFAPVQIFTPPPEKNTILQMAPPKPDVRGLGVTLHRLEATRPQSVTVQALDRDGAAIAQLMLNFAAGHKSATGEMVLPLPLRNRLQLLQVPQYPSAGSSWVFDSGWVRPLVGLITSGGDIDRQPLLSGTYYLGKALAPFAQVQRGPVDDLLELQPAVMVLTDPVIPDDVELEKLDRFVQKGGLLIRFAGPHLATSVDDLVPVRLRSGGRLMGGAFGWESPQKLAPFAADSPFAGLNGGQDAAVRRQVLALPDDRLNERTWARLSDGTPLVTSAPRGKGRIVLFHVTASPDWSDLPLSGLFAAMLERTLAFAGRPSATAEKPVRDNWVLEQALSARGALHPPKGAAPVLPATQKIENVTASPQHPPGLYRNGALSRAINIGRTKTDLTPLPAAPPGVRMVAGVGARPVSFKAPLLLAALFLLMADTIAALVLAGRLRGLGRLVLRRDTLSALALVLFLLPASPGKAQDTVAKALKIAQDTHLAYMITGSPRVDAMSKAGLFGLSLTLRQRTTVEPAMPVGVDPERDELAVFPLIYWPVVRPPALSPKAAAALNTYLKNGGMLVIDAQDDGQRAIAAGGVDPALKALFAQIRIPPLQPVPADHVLTRSYYLIHSFPGRTTGGRLWVEADVRGSSLDGVSGVIVGANDWAAAWALDENGRPMAALSDDMPRQREMARRFGVNLVMYALTGNYKADQVHIPALLQRLGEQ